jgi:nucleoside deoxyribosyltransferase
MNIYVSGPFFNKEEKERMDRLKLALLSHYPDDVIYFPMDLSIPNAENISNIEWAKAIYDADIKALDEAELVIVVYDGHYSDSGTAFEIGYAIAKNIPIYILVVDRLQDQSIMITNCTDNIWEFDQFIEFGAIEFLRLDLGRINQK